MQTIAQDNSFAATNLTSRAGSRPRLWAGRTLSWLAVLFFSSTAPANCSKCSRSSTERVSSGIFRDIVFTLGVILLSCVVVYLIPRTAVLGALLLTGYLGGAVATHVRVAKPAVQPRPVSCLHRGFIWGGLCCATRGCCAFAPWRRQS